MSVDLCVKALQNLSALLDKGAAHATAKKFDPAVLVNARLAPDMHPLSRQVQIACDVAKNGCSRLAGVEPPRIEDTEQTLDELKARIARTVELVKALPLDSFEGAEDRDLRVPMGPERVLEIKGLAFLQGFLLPNLYFHVTTAYAILRHNGVEIGKRDYLG